MNTAEAHEILQQSGLDPDTQYIQAIKAVRQSTDPYMDLRTAKSLVDRLRIPKPKTVDMESGPDFENWSVDELSDFLVKEVHRVYHKRPEGVWQRLMLRRLAEDLWSYINR